MGKDSALKLYNALKSQGKYTKSFAEFQGILGDKQRSQKLYTALSNDGLYTKTFSDFSNQFGSGSETPHTTRTQTTTPKKSDFVADTIDMLRTPSSQYTRPQPSKAAGTFEMPSKYDIYHNMPDAIKRHQTPTPLKPEAVMPSVPSSAAESVWAAADKAAGAEVRKKVDEGWSWRKIMQALSSGASVTGGLGDDNAQALETTSVAHLKTHDLQKLSDQAWAALGSKQQQSIINDSYIYLKEQYPDADDKALVDAARKMARAKSDEQMYNLAVEKNMPKSVGEFFLRKAAAASSFGSLSKGYASMMAGTRGDMEAEDTALQKYGAKHKVADIAGSVAGFAVDPLTYASGAVGGAATKVALWAGGKALSEAAARKMSQTLGGKLLLSAVGGAANFGTFEAGGEALNQYKWGGTLNVDPETGRYVVGDFSLGKVASQMRHGLTMGGLTGAFGTWLGNVSTKAAQATTSTLGKLGVRAGELGVGLVGEGTIFATPEFISTYGDYNDIIKSVSDKNSPNYIADDKERSKYIAEIKAQRGERMMDIWQDNLAMIAGFKAQHAIKSAGRTISELAASRRGKVGFVERMGRMLDGHPSLALSKEEQAELDKHGYGDLTQMVKEYKAYAQKDGDLPYNKITQLLNDKNVSEAARAKMYYYVTGHSLPMSAVIASNVIDNGDKTYTVQSLGDNGVITSRTYGSLKRADSEKARIDRQAELNGVAMAEQMFDNMDKAERLKAVCTRLAQDKGVSPETLLWLTRKDPKQMTAAEKRWIKEIEDAANEDAPQGENATVRHIKGIILDEYGVDVDKALRKAADSRTDAEKTAISAYNNELAQAVAERKNAISQGETTDAYRRGYEADTQGMRDAYVAQMYEPSEDNAETLRGVESQITESAKYQAALERDELKQMTHKDGFIHLATLKDKDKDGNGKQVYIVDGDIVMKEDGSGIDADASSKSVIIYDPATGEKKMVSPTAVDGIESLGEVKTAEQREAEINARMQDTIQSGKDWLEGNVANPVGMQIQLGDGRIATIEAMHEDGKSAIATLHDGTQFLVPNDVLQRIVNNGQYADYKARRDAEASKREAEQSTESAPETATEGGQPLPEEAPLKEEESREYAQGDVFDVVVDGQKMHAEIVSPKDADGRFVVNVDDGESMRTLYVTPEELAAMEYREEPSPKAEETRLATEDSSDKALERGAQPTEEHTPTALERIPRDEKGNAQFHDVDTETAWDGLVEMSGNEETAHKVAEASLANAERKLKAAKALKEEGETPEELLRSIKENEAAVAEAQRVVDAWKAIVGEESRREAAAKAEAERIATEKAEAERKAAEERERAEKEEKARIEAEKKEAERIAAEKAEEEARVEAERKAEEERKAKEEERKERDENGQPFVVSSDGTTTFGEITEDTGLTAAPIKLSEGVADEKGNGYGLRHIEARHGDQIRKAGFSSVEEFVKYVASNYDKHNIKIGKKRANGVETYLIQAEDEHSNMLYVELSKDGSYWNVNSGGIFRKGYAEKKKDVGQNTEHPTSATTLQDKSFVQTDKDNGSQSADTHSDKQHPSADKGTTLAADQQSSDKENTKKVADSEGENTLKAKIEAASADVNTEPTEAQKEAGNYKKGHVQVGTFDITIEQPEGSIRRGTDADGKQWEIKMHNTYGYFRGTEGVDGDHIDVFLSNDIDGWNGRKVFVVDQYNPDGTFDEHKVMLGFNDMDEAKSDYLANYEKGWENGRRITVSTTNLEDFEKWIDSSHRKTKPFSEYSSVNKETVATDKGGEKAEKKQKKQSVFDKAKEIADKEEKKRKAEADKPKQKPLTEAERKDAEEVAGALGYRVEWVDTMEENGTIDADKKVIRIAKDAENPLVQVLGHEVAHGVKRMDGGKFKALQKAAMEVVGEKEWNERIEKKRKLNAYAEGKLAEEVTCDIVGEALNNKDALKRLAESLRGEKGILARLRDAVARMVEYFKNRGDKEGVRRMKAADKLLAEFESALKEGVAPEQVKPEGVDRSEREGKKDDKTLYGVHNISEDKLRKAMKLGGLANPSMAVVDKDKGTHEGFGAISLIAPSSLVDKQTGHTAGTWITDAYTQRYPSVERVMSDKGYEKFKSWVDGLDFAEKEKKEIMRQATDAMESDKDLAWELMYLREKGVDVKGYTSEVDYPWEKIIEEYPSVEDIIKAMDHNAELKETVTKLAKVEITGPVYRAVSADVRRRFKEETGENASPLNPIIRKRTHDIYNRDYAPKLLDENGMPKASDVRKVIGQMVEKYNATKKVDFNKSKSKASTYVHGNGLYADYLKWQEGKLEEFGTQGRIFRGYKNDGTRKYVPETLSNVSKAMKEESQGQTNGSEYTSFGSFIAKLAPRVDSKEEMRGSKSRLDADEAKQEFYEKWESTYYDLATELHSDVFSGEARLHDIVLQSDPKRYAKKEYGITLSPSFLKRLEALKKAIREDLKSAYFETKFERPVMLNEFAAAVVPKGIGDDVRKGLEDAGLVLYEYDPAKKGDRERAANEASASDGIRFNRSEKTELTAEERELRDNLVERMRKGGLDVVTDSEEMQRVIDTENERTRMMGAGSVREHRVYHGSGADFDAFDHSHMGEGEGAQAYGWGTYVTEVEGIGRTYAIQNTTTHNDALRALQHDVDAISDQLNRHRDDLKYDEEQLKRANEWRAEAELDYELFRDEAEKLKEKYGEASPKYRNHLFNDIYTDEMKRAQSSVKSTEESIQYRKEKIAELEKALNDKQAEIDELPKEFPRHLYTVEIPDDNGGNYLDWYGHPAESLLKDVGSFLESEGFERVQDNPARYEKGESTVVLNPKATGADLYAELQEALGSDKKASQALAELGYTGIKYPADNMRGGREDGAKNYVIFNENDAKITDHVRFLRTAGGEVYGLVKDGRIYLDPKVATAETAVHEYTHLWGDMLRRKDSEQWSHTVKELKNSVLWEEVKELYPELKTDDEIADEVLSTFSGRRGAERLREEARRVADGDGGVFTKAKAIETLERVKEAIARFWEGVARMFGINRYRSAEELADMAMKDLINGVKPTSRTFTFDNFYKDTKAVFEGTERPKGKPDYISYSGSEYWYGEDKGGKYVVRGSDHWSGEFKVKDGERTNVGRNHYSEITEDGMLPIGAQGSLKFGWEKGLSKPVGSGISAAIDRRGSGDSNNIASCYWYIDNAKEKDNKGFTYGKAYLSEFEDKERRRDIPGDDWRDIQGLEGGTRAMAERIAEQPVEEINNRFNEELEKYQNNELPKGHRFELGMPSAELQSAGFPTLPISMRSSLLAKKAGAERHPFAPTDLRDLVNAIQKPIAIFKYSKDNMRNLIVDVSRGGKHFLVGVTLNYKADNIEINSVSGLFPKENHEWIKWIQDGKVLRIDQKEKVQDLINSLRTNPAESERIGLNLDDVAKKVKDFENPKLFSEEIIDDGKKGSDSTDRSVRENPKNEDKPRYSRKPGESIFDYASRVSEDVDRSVRERVSARDEYEKKVKSKGFQTKEALQNSMLGLQEFMSAIDHASGNKRYIEDIPDFENPILGENRLSSVNKEEMHQVAKTQFKPLMSAVAKLSGNGKESGELYDYMFAKHGLERDAVMRQREAQKEFDKYQKANPKGTKTIGDFVASLEGKDYAGLTALTAEDGRVKSIQSQIDAIDEQMKATDDQLLLHYLGGQKKRLKVDLLNAARDAADDIRKAFESNPSHDRSDINELWSRVNEVNGNTLRKLYESGMLTKEAYNDISSMYTNYIPMRGFDQTTSADAYAYLTHGDSAFNAPIKTAKGRSSKADNPIAYMQAMAESAIMQGNRNVLVKQKMLNFVRNHPSDLASVSDVWLQYDSVADEWKPVFPDNIGANDSASVVAKKMEAFEDKMKQMAEKHPDLVQRSNEAPDIPYKVVEKGQLNEHQVLVKQNGKSYIITVNGSPRAAQAANGLTNPDTDLTGAIGKVFEGAEALNRQLSSLYTTLNPDFIGSNYVRDALYSNTMVYVKEGAKYGGFFNLNFAKYNPAEMANLYARYNKGSLDTSNETHRLFLEFMQNGGETGFVNLKQIEKRKSEIAKAIKRDGRISAAQIWGGLGDAVDFANRAVENSARFAAYVTSRKSGRSVGRSVYDAKEISVNFNRKGSGSKFMGAEGQTKAGNAAAFVSGAGRGLYVFWNAGLQGLTNFSRQIGRHPGRALTLASLLFGFGALMSYLGNRDDDDENNYFNLPKYIRRSNVCYKIGDLFVTIPLPVEYRAFYGLGELASSTLAGKEDGTTKDIAKEAVSQVSQLFPIDFAEGGGGLHALIPSAVKPIVEAETNTAWTGLPIYKDNDFNKNMPEYTKVYKTANGHLVEIARALNDATGGNKYKKGFIDINPAKMEYVLKGMLGGAFSFPDKLVKTTETIMGDREFDWRNIPFANRFVKNADERTEYKSLNEQYFKLKDEMDVVKQQLKGFEKEADAGNEKYEKALLQLEDSKDYERLELFKDYEKELKGLNDELKELRMSPDYDKAEEKELQKEIAELQRQLIDEMREIKK